MSVRAWMKHTVSVCAETETQDTTGASEIAYPTVTNTLKCFVDPAKAEEFVLFREKRIQVSHNVYFISDPGIDEADSLLFNGRRLFVLSVQNFAEAGKVWKVKCGEGIQGNWK